MENNTLVKSSLILVSQELHSLTDLTDQGELQKDLQHYGSLRLTEQPFPLVPFLEYKDSKLTLQMPSGLQLQVNFFDKKYHRVFTPSKDLLCRACGWHLGLRRVWDLTAGLGVDSILLAQAGFDVKALERNPSLALLLRQALRIYQSTFLLQQQSSNTALQNLALNETSTSNAQVASGRVPSNLDKVCFEWAEALDFLNQSQNETLLPEVIYYDPMYPAKNKTALPSKEMQILRELNGVNEDNPEIIATALNLKIKRVVVKRPLNAKVILEKPSFQLSSKLVRYDVYIRR